MKKLIIFILIGCCFLTACSTEKKEVNNKKEEIEEKEEENVTIPVDTYQDLNNTPISFYELKNSYLTIITDIKKTLYNLEDIGLFQIFPSCESEIHLNKSFAESFKEEWDKYNTNHQLKMGYSLSFETKEDGLKSFNIFNPNDTMKEWEYIMTYLYDDYCNRNNSSYSHLEVSDYKDSTLLTAIKLQSGHRYHEIVEKIELKVFTYDTDDDFENAIYRGNSTSTLTINII